MTVATPGIAVNGTTAADGSVTLDIPSGTTANLQIFDTVYPITVRRTIEAPGTTKGAQRRLSLLGYELGGIDGQVGEKTDRATLNLQADSNLDADGVIGNKTRAQLRTKFGE
jgi:peptidoglycan hydrolase-like protein with peptidoglycan-binding domain